MLKIKTTIGEGEMLPPWYYGHTYYDYEKGIVVFHIIPVNYVIIVFRGIQHYWNKFRSKPSWIDSIALKRTYNPKNTIDGIDDDQTYWHGH